MNTATLTSTQFNILEAPISGSELFNRLIFQNKSVSPKDTLLLSNMVVIGTLLVMIVAAFGIYEFYQAFNDILLNPLYNPLFYAFFIVANGWFAFSGLTYLYKLHLYLKYKSIESVSEEALPAITVIVSSYNEGKEVYNTLLNLAKSDYPEEKLQIVAIDNGSNDDTWSWMHEAKNDLGDRVEILKQSKKTGEDQALNRAFNIGTGEIFVTVDKGAVIIEDTLRNLVSTFIVNKKRSIKSKRIKILNSKKQYFKSNNRIEA